MCLCVCAFSVNIKYPTGYFIYSIHSLHSTMRKNNIKPSSKNLQCQREQCQRFQTMLQNCSQRKACSSNCYLKLKEILHYENTFAKCIA